MERGISIIGAVFTLLILAVFGAAMTAIVANDQTSRTLQIAKEQAFYEVQAGLEYAVREINNGGYPAVTNKTLGRGNFTNTIDFPNHFVFSTGASGNVSKTHQITVNPMAGDCLTINSAAVTLGGPGKTDIQGIILNKTCLNAVTIDKIKLSWEPNAAEKITRVTIAGRILYDSATGARSGEVIELNDYTISGAGNIPIDLIKFTGNMANKRMVMTIYLSDTSFKGDAFTNPP